MAAFSHISGAEPSTVTFKAATVTQTRNSSVMHQEIISLGDPDSSLAIAAVLNTAPASTAWGVVTRPLGPVTIQGNSTVLQGTSPWTIAGNSTVVVASGNSSVIVTSGNSSVIVTSGNSSVIVTSGNITSTCVQGTNPWIIAGNSTVVQAAASNPWITASVMQSSVMPSSGSSGSIVRQVWDVRANAASTNAMAGSTAFSVASSAVGKVYVTAYSITSTVQAPTVLRFMSGSTLMWPVVLAALSSAVTGVNLSGYPFLFCSPAAGRPVTLNIPSTVAGFRVGVSYFRAP